MLRNLFAIGCRSACASLTKSFSSALPNAVITSNNGALVTATRAFSVLQPISKINLSRSLLAVQPLDLNPVRNVIKYSLNKGKRKSVKLVLRKFYRLDWGIWIRGRAGRHKKIYTKSWRRRKRLRQHVFTNATQSWLLDTMVTKYWRRPKYLPDSPYNPYHKREEFPTTRRKPHIPIAS